MIKVKLTYPFNWPIVKQTPNRSGVWGDCVLYINEEIEECDFWVVFEGLERKDETRCPLENTLLITAEPPSIRSYHPKFIKQFNSVLTSHNFDAKNIIHSQQALNWMVGGRYVKSSHSWEKEYSKDYDELSAIKEFNKEKLLSIVVSNKSMTKGHQDRLKFIAVAKDHFGESLDVFGIGFSEIADKWDAIYPYKYHIAIENSVYENYWTEKISDAFLGGAYPLYYGCPNIRDYFSSDSMSLIDIQDASWSLKKIDRLIADNKYESSGDYINQSRDLVLNKYNLMAVINDFCRSRINKTSANKKRVLFPERCFQQRRFSIEKIKSLLKIS